ncbi:MAG: SPFH domain-containing protein [Azoarcus sp.]|jgi:membrane protease subunit (stomatin/prohibitin family)|nr:SPFH domain-containing protein [Azoarcus sp.]
MAFMDFLKKQFIDVIQCVEDDADIIAWRFPMRDFEIQYGASLTVRESQMAVFINEGKFADVFGPGRYTLTTQTLPLLTNLEHWDKLFQSPFKSDVYFFSTRARLDRKWGTGNPITVRDKEFGAVRLRAFGIYSYHVADPKLFHSTISGTIERYTTEQLEGQLRNTVAGSIANLFGESSIPFLDMAANQEAFGAVLKEKLTPVFAGFGLMLDNFVVQNISLPEELEKVLDARIGMGVAGDLGRFTQYQVAQAIPLAAQNEGGAAGAGVGIGAGISMGQAMAQNLQAATQNAAASPAVSGSLADEITATLEKLHALVGKGILSQAEFDAKKEELLKKLG